MKLLLFVTALCFSTHGLACDSSLTNTSLPKLTIQQAKGKLNRALLSLNSDKMSARASVDEIDCYLRERTVFFPELKHVHSLLKELGDAAISAKTGEQRQAAANNITRLISRDAGTGFVQFPHAKDEKVSFSLFTTLIDEHCGDVPSRACGNAADLAKKLWWIAGNYRAFSSDLYQPDQTR